MRNWALYLIFGILAIITGGIAMVYPQITSVAVSVFISWAFIIFGIGTVILGFMNNRGASLFWSILLGVLMTITGVVLLRNPDAGVGALAMVLAILSLGTGVVMIIATFTPGIGSYRWLSLIGGISSLLLAWLIFSDPALSIGVLFGLQLIVDGFAMVVFALSVREMGRD